MAVINSSIEAGDLVTVVSFTFVATRKPDVVADLVDINSMSVTD